MTLSDSMRAAAEIIEDRWTRHVYYRGANVCAVGAVALAQYGGVDTGHTRCIESLIDSQVQFIRKTGSYMNPASSIEEFNDSSDTCKEDVQTLLLLLAEVIDSDASDEEIRRDIEAALVALARMTEPAEMVLA